jgi:DNA modification methylase
VRLSGDGPSSWTDWLVVSRTAKQVKWGTLPGGYINRGGSEHMGGKPLGLMCRLVEDYSRSGDTVCDPTMGSGTTGIACLRTGRNFIGIEKDPAHFATAVERIERESIFSYDDLRVSGQGGP